MDISVIVPSYNEEKYIEKTLRSIKSQRTGFKYEIILSDSHSTDKTVKIASKYADKMVTDKQRGIFRARNNGAAAARGKLLVFIDSDTRILPDYLEEIGKKFIACSSLAAASFGFKFSGQTPAVILAEELVNDYLIMRSRFGIATLPGFNTAVLAEKFRKMGGYKDVYLEDVRFSRDIEKIGRIEYFGEKKAITSSRKLENMGLIGSLRYYFELDLLEGGNKTRAEKINSPLKSLNKIKNRILQKAIKNKSYKGIR